MADPTDPSARVHLRVIDVDRQLDLAGLFQHGMTSETLDRMHDLAAWAWTAIEILLDRGLISPAELKEVHQRVRDSLAERHWSQRIGFALNADQSDKYAAEPAVVDCAARIPLCKGACCYMDHPLQISDVQEGIVKWDHARPYFIRHTADHHCVHQDTDSKGCGVFANRPLICRLYSCANDKRIWIDFEARIPNSETIARLLDGTIQDPEPPMIEGTVVKRSAVQIEVK